MNLATNFILPIVVLALFGWFLPGCKEQTSSSPIGPSDGSFAPSRYEMKNMAKRREVWFEELAESMGLTYHWPMQPRPMRINEAFGCGCAVLDIDLDGWHDLLLVADPHPVLYRNDMGKRFVDITQQAGLVRDGNDDWTGCAIGDFNGDGRQDFLLTGIHRLALYRNIDGTRFEEATSDAGLPRDNHGHWGASAGFMDLNNDGWLDLVILNYVAWGPHVKHYCELNDGVKSGCPPSEYVPEKGEVWRNLGDGKFERVSAEGALGQSNGAGLVLAFSDLDGDNQIDFYVGNDGQIGDLFHNQGNFQFLNRGVSSGLAYGRNMSAMAAMGADWGDYNRDGRLDLAVTNWDRFCFALFCNRGKLRFADHSGPTGVAALTATRLGFGVQWLDFDNDGWLDLSFVNGHVYDNCHEITPGSTYRQPTLLLRNEQGKRFVDIARRLPPRVGRPLVARGSATVDVDNDGRMDLVIVDYEGRVVLLANRSENKNHWLKLDVRGQLPNQFGYGARLIGRAQDQVWISEVTPASSYLSSKDRRIHWGLGSISKLETLTVRWPSGREHTLTDVAGDQILVIDEPGATP
jgi:hypothetical protein